MTFLLITWQPCKYRSVTNPLRIELTLHSRYEIRPKTEIKHTPLVALALEDSNGTDSSDEIENYFWNKHKKSVYILADKARTTCICVECTTIEGDDDDPCVYRGGAQGCQ